MPRDDLGKGAFALPGGFVHHGHSLDPTVQRVLVEKTGLTGIALEQLATYGDPARDPRGHVVSVVYLALLPATQLAQASLAAGLQLADIRVNRTGETGASAWARAKGAVLPLAFDHAAILGDTIKRLRGKIDYSLIGFAFLPPRFTLRAVQEVHEAILGRSLDKPAFRRKLLDRGILQKVDEATFARRALAMDKERAMTENELANQIELAARRSDLIARLGEKDRSEAEAKAAAERIATEAEAANTVTHAEADAARILLVETTAVEAERDRMAVMAGLPVGAFMRWPHANSQASSTLSTVSTG